MHRIEIACRRGGEYQVVMVTLGGISLLIVFTRFYDYIFSPSIDCFGGGPVPSRA